MNIHITLADDLFDGIFYLDKKQITVIQHGQFWYADPDDIGVKGMEWLYDDLDSTLDLKPSFTYNDFFRIMMKLAALSEFIN